MKERIELRGCSLFSGAGIAEAFFKDIGVNIVLANELLPERAELYSEIYKDTTMICGDITDKKIFKKLLLKSDSIDLLIATPPCQGLSLAGKNRSKEEIMHDKRNYLIEKVIDFILKKSPKYVLIENVPSLLNLTINYKEKQTPLIDVLILLFGKEYNVEARVVDSSDYGVPQTRKRAIIKLFKKGLSWDWPEKSNKISVREAIGHLPSLESGDKSDIPWHYAREHTKKHILWMKNTPTGKSAFENKVYFPKKDDGTRIKGYNSTYRRIKWDQPAPTITMRNDAISSQRNVHPGRKKKDGTYSDPRVLTPLELMLISSLPKDWKIPKETPELLLRQCIGEGVPPLMIKKLIEPIIKNEIKN